MGAQHTNTHHNDIQDDSILYYEYHIVMYDSILLTVGNPRRAQIVQSDIIELVLILRLDKRFPVEQFDAAVSQSTVTSPS